MAARRIRALTLAAGLVGWNGLVDPLLPSRWQPLVRGLVGSGLLQATGARPGLRPPVVWAGLRVGAAAAGVVTAGVVASTAIPAVRRGMGERDLPPAAGWLLLRIPVGTVWSEEAAFRAALAGVCDAAFGPASGQLLQATAFGLSHIAVARATGQSVVATVVVTAVAGWVLGRLALRSGSLVAPMLAHLAINEVAAVLALRAQRGLSRRP